MNYSGFNEDEYGVNMGEPPPTFELVVLLLTIVAGIWWGYSW